MVFWMCECPVTKYYSEHHLQSFSVLLCSNGQTSLVLCIINNIPIYFIMIIIY